MKGGLLGGIGGLDRWIWLLELVGWEERIIIAMYIANVFCLGIQQQKPISSCKP